MAASTSSTGGATATSAGSILRSPRKRKARRTRWGSTGGDQRCRLHLARVDNMDLSDVITPEAILPSLKANSKKQVLQAIAEKAAAMTGVEERDIFDTLNKREKLGSTGVGGGIAIPHGKLAKL